MKLSDECTSRSDAVVHRALFVLVVAASGCGGSAADSDPPDGFLKPTAGLGGPVRDTEAGPAATVGAGQPSSVAASTMEPAPRPPAEPVPPARAERPSSSDTPSMAAVGEPAIDGDGTAGTTEGDPVAPADEPPTTEVFPDVPEPVFEGPWFPCPQDDYPEHTITVRTHDNVVHTSASTKIDAEVDLPVGSFKAVALRVEHECPTGGTCDLYDRRAVVELVNQNGAGEENLALMRYVTTYRFRPGQTNHMCSWTDVTPYASRLTGQQTIRSWLDTVVSPGHELGDGWQVSAELVFYPGPAAHPSRIEELYGTFINIGEAPGSIDEQTPVASVEIPMGVTQVVAPLTVSGHGWGPENSENCAEFCRLDQTISVNGGTPHVIDPFRDDCARNPLAPLQQRNPTGSRNGWCPGAVVLPHTIDITGEVTPGMPADINFGVQRADGSEYIDADPAGYNPNEFVSLQLFMSTAGTQ